MSTSEVAGPLLQVEGKVKHTIEGDIITLTGFAFYGGDAVSSGEQNTILDMFISKRQIGLGGKLQLTAETSLGTYIVVGGDMYTVTMSDLDLRAVKLSFTLPSAGLRVVNTFTYSIQHKLFRPCQIVKGYDTGIEQFGPAFVHGINNVPQNCSIAVGPQSTLVMTNSTIQIRKKCGDDVEEIYTQNSGGGAFWPPASNGYGSRPMFNHVVYDRFAGRFVIAQVRQLRLPDSFVFTASEVLFAVSKSSNPTLANEDWRKFSFAQSVPTDVPIPPDTESTNIDYMVLSYDADSYYVGIVTETILNHEETDKNTVYRIGKERPLIAVEVLTLISPSSDNTSPYSRLVFPQMLEEVNHIYVLYHLDNSPLIVYRISVSGIKKRTLPVILAQLGNGTAVCRDGSLWFSYEVSGSGVVWYEVNIKTLRVIQSQYIINSVSTLKVPSIMTDARGDMLLTMASVVNDIWSLVYTFRRGDDVTGTTRDISVIRQGSQRLEVPERLEQLAAWTSINGGTFHSHGAYSERTGNWKSTVFSLAMSDK